MSDRRQAAARRGRSSRSFSGRGRVPRANTAGSSRVADRAPRPAARRPCASPRPGARPDADPDRARCRSSGTVPDSGVLLVCSPGTSELSGIDAPQLGHFTSSLMERRVPAREEPQAFLAVGSGRRVRLWLTRRPASGAGARHVGRLHSKLTSLEAAVRDRIADREPALVGLLQRLIGFDTASREPLVSGGEIPALQAFLADRLARHGAAVALTEPDAAMVAGHPYVPEGFTFAGRPQLVARFRGGGRRPEPAAQRPRRRGGARAACRLALRSVRRRGPRRPRPRPRRVRHEGRDRRDGRRRRGVARARRPARRRRDRQHRQRGGDHGRRWAGRGTDAARRRRDRAGTDGVGGVRGLPRLAAGGRDGRGTRRTRRDPAGPARRGRRGQRDRQGARWCSMRSSASTSAGRRRTGIRASHPPTASPPRSTAASGSSATPPPAGSNATSSSSPSRPTPAGGAPRPGASSRPRSAAPPSRTSGCHGIRRASSGCWAAYRPPRWPRTSRSCRRCSACSAT